MSLPGPIPTALATGGVSWEPDLLAGLSRRTEVLVVRRCVDLPDLLATAAAGTIRAAVVGSSLHRLDRDTVASLRRLGVAVVGVVDLDAQDEVAGRRLGALGIDAVLPSSAAAADIAAAVASAVGALEPLGSSPPALIDPDEYAMPAVPSVEPGRVIAVWGPVGAPGRTTIAVNLASELARSGVSTLLADADTYGASVAQTLGLLDEAPGLAAAARAANQGKLDLAGLVRHARQVEPELKVLTGLPRADRWPELRPAALTSVWQLARTCAAMTVIDCGFALEESEEISFDVAAPRRNAATLVSLEQADLVLAVGSADPIGLQRLVRGLAELAEAAPAAQVRVVINRVRRGVSGGERRGGPISILRRHAGIDEAWSVPDNADALDAALMAGRPLAEVAPRAPARLAIKAMAAELAGERSAERAGRSRARHRSSR